MLEPGDRAPHFLLADIDGKTRSPVENQVAGKPLVLLFQGGDGPGYAEFGDRIATFDEFDAVLFVIARCTPAENCELQGRLGDAPRVLADPTGEVFRSYGCTNAAIFVLDLNSRIIDVYAPSGGSTDVDRALAEVGAAYRDAPEATLSMHAPVLVLPRVLDRPMCRRLMAEWEKLDSQATAARGAKRNQASSDFFDAYGHVRQHVPRDPALLGELDARLPRRLGQEILKVFQTSIARREDYRIAHYDAADQGRLSPHRDNMTPATKHRRFTVSIQLNPEEYEGGELRFPEYGRQLYRGATGTAIAFSASLLHEVVPVTRGRRFMLGTHLFGN